MNDKKGSLATKIFAWSGIILILIFIILILYSLITSNGMLALASIICLIILSLVYWLGILAYKRLTKMKGLEDEMRENTKILTNSNLNTKSI